jgi:hypothetical protein
MVSRCVPALGRHGCPGVGSLMADSCPLSWSEAFQRRSGPMGRQENRAHGFLGPPPPYRAAYSKL